MRAVAIWAALLLVIAVPLVVAATSPLLQWRQPVYIAAGFAGAFALALLLLQPLLAAGMLPGARALAGRRLHRAVGVSLVLAVVIHVAGLWITSPPDVVDALLFRSPTPFSAWGVVAMAALFATAALAAARRRLHLRWGTWRRVHGAFGLVIVVGSVVHALLIEGTMGPISKAVLCGVVLLVTVTVFLRLRLWSGRAR